MEHTEVSITDFDEIWHKYSFKNNIWHVFFFYLVLQISHFSNPQRLYTSAALYRVATEKLKMK